jgi:hypothetical protein
METAHCSHAPHHTQDFTVDEESYDFMRIHSSGISSKTTGPSAAVEVLTHSQSRLVTDSIRLLSHRTIAHCCSTAQWCITVVCALWHCTAPFVHSGRRLTRVVRMTHWGQRTTVRTFVLDGSALTLCFRTLHSKLRTCTSVDSSSFPLPLPLPHVPLFWIAVHSNSDSHTRPCFR